jgi:hypothetical protein
MIGYLKSSLIERWYFLISSSVFPAILSRKYSYFQAIFRIDHILEIERTHLLFVITENGHIFFQLKVKGNLVVMVPTQVDGVFLDFLWNDKTAFYQRFHSPVLFVGDIEATQKNIIHILFFCPFRQNEGGVSIFFSRLSLSMEDVDSFWAWIFACATAEAGLEYRLF